MIPKKLDLVQSKLLGKIQTGYITKIIESGVFIRYRHNCNGKTVLDEDFVRHGGYRVIEGKSFKKKPY